MGEDTDSIHGRIAKLEAALEKSRETNREMGRMLEEKGRELSTAREQLKAQTRAAQQHSTLGILAEHESFDEASRQLLASLCSDLGWPVAILWQLDEDATTLRCERVWGQAGLDLARFIVASRLTTVERGVGLPGRAWELGCATYAVDSPASTKGLFPACAVPVAVRARTIAVIEFYALAATTTDLEMLETLDGIGIQLGQALERRFERRDARLRDLALARRIQTSLMPRELRIEGFEVVAAMLPAEEVGGDYYDVLPTTDGMWVGIGDVSGHGLASGLIMLMVQSGVASLVGGAIDAAPRDVVRSLNRMLFDNIRNRLQSTEFVTFMLARVRRDGRVTLAGAHEDLLVARASGGPCERVRVPGTWLGVIADIGDLTSEVELELAPGDVAVFYTDGVTEARGCDKQRFGLERLAAIVEEHRTSPPAEIADAVFRSLAAFKVTQEDDETILVMRRV